MHIIRPPSDDAVIVLMIYAKSSTKVVSCLIRAESEGVKLTVAKEHTKPVQDAVLRRSKIKDPQAAVVELVYIDKTIRRQTGRLICRA
jgi:hypothetical protein